jgi:predicted ferric reductase
MANSVSVWSQFSDFLANAEDVFLAFISVMIFGYIIFLSISVVRKKLRYELWYFVHLLVYVAITLAFFHQINSGDVSRAPTLYYWLVLNFTVFGIMLLHRFVKPLWQSYRFDFRVARVDMETKDTYSVYIIGNNIGRFRYHAGQYANINFLQKGLWYTHPFSFSAEPNEAGIRFTMKALGDYTKRLGELKAGTRVIIDGPLGRFVETKAKREKLLMIAGGIGVTPIRALIGELVAKKKDMVLLYAARSVEDIAFRGEFDALQSTCNFPIHYILGAPTPGYESGFIDREKIVRLVPDFYDRDVFLCGPPPMMDATVKNLEGLGLERDHIHFEKFSF